MSPRCHIAGLALGLRSWLVWSRPKPGGPLLLVDEPVRKTCERWIPVLLFPSATIYVANGFDLCDRSIVGPGMVNILLCLSAVHREYRQIKTSLDVSSSQLSRGLSSDCDSSAAAGDTLLQNHFVSGKIYLLGYAEWMDGRIGAI